MALAEAVAGLAALPGVRTAAQLATPSSETPDAPGGTLPVSPALAGLLPAGGLRRGTTVTVAGSAALVIALLAEATRAGSWAAITGIPDLGVAAAAELGVDLDCLALIPDPGTELVAVLSALIDGFDLVVLGPVAPHGVQPQLARRLAGRVRNRGAVLLSTTPWPGADLELTVSQRRWHGINAGGSGYLHSRELVATCRGRGAAARPGPPRCCYPGQAAASPPASPVPRGGWPRWPGERRRGPVAGAVVPRLAGRRRRRRCRDPAPGSGRGVLRQSRRHLLRGGAPQRDRARDAPPRCPGPVPGAGGAPAQPGPRCPAVRTRRRRRRGPCGRGRGGPAGIVAVPVAGAASYFGGEEALAELQLTEVEAHAGVECQAGVADGLFAATLATRRAAFVPPGGTAAFLAPLSVAELDQPGDERGELVGLLQRLGLRTLGAFAALTEREVAGRFPLDAITAHRIARGFAQRPPVRRALPPDLAITETFEHPLERVDEAAFVAKTLGERFFAGLARHGLACTRLAITALTDAGEERVRVWRCAEPLTARTTADRVRWQCEGWLTVRVRDRPSAGIVRLTLDPEEVVGGNALQLQLGSMGQDADAAERADRALVRIQGLLGPDAVYTPLLDGGRGPAERVRLVPWGEPRHPTLEDRPWPGRLPTPSPALVPSCPASVSVLDAAGDVVRCNERGELTHSPATIVIGDGPPRRVLASAGPWPVRAVSPSRSRPAIVRVQVVVEGTDDDDALLLRADAASNPRWTVEGDYQ